MTETKLTPHSKVRDQIDIIERLGTKLRYGVSIWTNFVVYPYSYLDLAHLLNNSKMKA